MSGSTSIAHSEALLALIDSLLEKNGGKSKVLPNLEAFAVGIGPGSFTGIRIACATIKSFAQVFKKPIIGFSSLQALAYSTSNELGNTVSVVNAYQGQMFFGWGNWNEGFFSLSEWNEKYGLNADNVKKDQKWVFCGTGAQAAIEAFSLVNYVKSDVIQISAAGICKAVYAGSYRTNYRNLKANYMRPSQAEVNLFKKIASRSVT